MKRKTTLSFLLVLIAAITLNLLTGEEIVSIQFAEEPLELEVESDGRETASIRRVVDGDTVVLSSGDRVRLIGIDTPELQDKECYAQEAKGYLTSLLQNKKVTLEKDITNTDRYDRLLRYLWLDGQLINQQLLANGYAKAVSYPPDIKYQQQFTQAQMEAQLQGYGLWTACEVVQ